MFHIENFSKTKKIFQISFSEFKGFLLSSKIGYVRETQKLLQAIESIKRQNKVQFVFADLNENESDVDNQSGFNFTQALKHNLNAMLLQQYQISLSIPCKHVICVSLTGEFLPACRFQSVHDKTRAYLRNQFPHLFTYSDAEKQHIWSSKFGYEFENIISDILNGSNDNTSSHNEDVGNLLVSHFNRYFKSKKNSKCVVLPSNSKTDIVYQNKNQSLNEISIKTTSKYDYFLNFGISLIDNCFTLKDVSNLLKEDFSHFFTYFFHKKYNKKESVPYLSKKHDNIKFLMIYNYTFNQENNAEIKGDLNVIPVKAIENELLNAFANKDLTVHVHNSYVLIRYKTEAIFRIVPFSKNNNQPKSKRHGSRSFNLFWMAKKTGAFFQKISTEKGFLNTGLELQNPFIEQ